MKKTALITGASAGLGEQFVSLFAAAGHNVVVVARRREKLEALKSELEKKYGVSVHVCVADLTDPHSPKKIANDVFLRGIEVEYLVNNAGFGTTGSFTNTTLERELQMVQVNISALIELTHLFLPKMIERKSGRILNIGSTAGFQPGPFMSVYYATKAFVNSFTEALAVELRGTGVTVTLSCPGPTITEFAEKAKIAQTRLFKMGAMTAEDVAKGAYRAMMKGSAIKVHGFTSNVAVQLLRVSPRKAVTGIAGYLNKGKNAAPH